MRHAVLVLALVALAAPVTATGERASQEKVAGTVLAIESGRRTDFLLRVDAQTLRPVSRRLALGGRAQGWSLSPRGRRLAVGLDSRRGTVVIFDLRRMKPVARIPTWSGGIGELAWVSPRRIIGWEQAGLFLLDPVARKRLQSPESLGDIMLARRAGNGLVVLAGEPLDTGPARLAAIGGDGKVRSVRLNRIRVSGSMNDDELIWPALVLDQAGRAYVVGAGRDEPVAEVDLEQLRVTYHEVGSGQSLLTRFRNWLEPAAAAKEALAGSWRTGTWLGNGQVAIWGYDSARVAGDRVETTPAGLSVIDTNDWTTRMIDADVWHAAFAGGTLIGTYQRGGLTGFGTDGGRRYDLFGREPLGVVATFDSRAFVAFDRKPVHVIDAATGRVLGTRHGVPRLLHRSFSGW